MMLVSWIPEVFCFGKHKNPKPKIHPPLNRFFLVDFFLGKGSPVPNQPVIWVFWVRFFMFLHSKKGQVNRKNGQRSDVGWWKHHWRVGIEKLNGLESPNIKGCW